MEETKGESLESHVGHGIYRGTSCVVKTGLLPITEKTQKKCGGPIYIVVVCPMLSVNREDFLEFKKWYVKTYDLFLAARIKFGFFFDLRQSAMPALSVIMSMFGLTVSLGPRTGHQVVASIVLMRAGENNTPAGQARNIFIQCVQKLIKKGDSAPRKLVTTRTAASSWLLSFFSTKKIETRLRITAEIAADVQKSRRMLKKQKKE